MVRDVDSGNESVSSGFERRTVLKTATGIGLGLGLTAASVGQTAASDLQAPGDERIEGELPYPDRGTMRVDDSVKSITPYYYLLTIGKDRLIELVETSNLEGRQKDTIGDFLKDAWREYPVQRGREGNDTIFSLASDQSRGAVADDEDEQFAMAARAVQRGSRQEDDDPSILWNGSNHNEMTEKTCQEFDLWDFQVDDIAGAAHLPDVDPCDGCSADMFPGSWAMPDWVKDKIEEGLEKVAHHYGHYYDPNQYSYTMAGIGIEFNGIGGAPWFCQYEMNQADNNCCSTEREYVGRATHYVQDVAVPLHSGMGIEQIGLGLDCDWSGCAFIDPYTDEHFGYENYVSRHLTSGENFLDEYDGLWVYNSNPISVVQNCADRANDYSYELFHLMVDNGSNPDNWTSSSDRNDLNEMTANCMTWAHGYTHALVNQMYDRDL